LRNLFIGEGAKEEKAYLKTKLKVLYCTAAAAAAAAVAAAAGIVVAATATAAVGGAVVAGRGEAVSGAVAAWGLWLSGRILGWRHRGAHSTTAQSMWIFFTT
jgi:hypothetical protein